MSSARALALVAILVFHVAPLAAAADGVEAAAWTPGAWKAQDTLDLQTIGPEEGEYWFPVWLVVLDDKVYVRLGTKAT